MRRLLLLKIKSKYIALLAMCFVSYLASAQMTVSGVVASAEDGLGIPGATVLEKGTSNGTITDVDGRYSITVSDPQTAVLRVSFVGYVNSEVQVAGRSEIDVSIEMDLQQLNEIVVVGYGSVRKSDNTGALSSIKSEELNAFPALSAVQTLQGRAAGVQIQSTNGGEPGANFSLKIRGGSSINASSEPLRVVDGFVGGEMPPPQDIQSMEILKDASATAIYGSRAANGVLLITTKSGGEGKMKVDFNSSYSYQEASDRLDLLSGEDFRDYILEVLPNYDYNPDVDTDWQDEILRSGHIWNNQVSVSGGSPSSKYYISATHFEQEGVVVNSDYERYSITSNLSFKASDRVNLGVNLYGRRSIQNGVLTQETTGGSSNTGVLGAAARLEPDTPVRDADGNFTQSKLGDNIDNPVAIANGIDRERITDRFQVNSFAEVKILDWLSFKSTLGAGVTSYREGTFTSSQLGRGGNGGIGTLEFDKAINLLTENYFTVKKDFDGHRINWVNGYSYQKSQDEDLLATSSDFVSEAVSYWNLGGGATWPAPNSGTSTRILKSYYSRLNYTLFDRYVFTVTGRYDGASNFAANNKWAFFPSGAIAWNIGDEAFMKNLNPIYSMKLRTSYGLTGNQAIGAYGSLATLRSQYSIRPGEGAFILGTLANPNLTWETTSQLNVGLDVGLIDDRINFTVDYYNKLTSDLLFDRPIPSFLGVAGTATQIQNAGEVRNKGLEAAITTRNIQRADFSWTSNFVFSMNRNEIVSLADTVGIRYEDAPGHFNIATGFQLLEIGQPVGVYYGFVYEGVTQPGDPLLEGSDGKIGGEQFADLNDDGILNDDDRKIIGNPHPDFVWSMNNNFTYKNFDLNIFLQGVHGNDMMNLTRMELESFRGTWNVSTAALDRYHPIDNAKGTIPSADTDRTLKVTSRWIEDGSYVRVKNIALGYNVPSSLLDKINVRSLRFYVSAQNLLTFTDYSGLDPETAYNNSTSNADSNRNLGLDYGSYPNVKTYTVGLNLGF